MMERRSQRRRYQFSIYEDTIFCIHHPARKFHCWHIPLCLLVFSLSLPRSHPFSPPALHFSRPIYGHNLFDEDVHVCVVWGARNDELEATRQMMRLEISEEWEDVYKLEHYLTGLTGMEQNGSRKRDGEGIENCWLFLLLIWKEKNEFRYI